MTDDAQVRQRLAHLPRPTMPPDVAQALQQRLAAESVVVPITDRHRRRLSWLVAAATVAGIVSLVGVTAGSPPASSPAPSAPVVRAGAVFEPDGFAEQVRARFHQAGNRPLTPTFADSPEGIAGCVRAVRAYGRVMALEVGTYAGSPAVVLVTTFVPNSDYEEVWVVSPGCGPGEATVIRHMVSDVDGSTRP